MKRNLEYYIFIKTGQVYEPPELAGISHFLEHIVFNYSFFELGLSEFFDQNGVGSSAQTSDYYTLITFDTLDKKLLQKTREKVRDLLINPIISKEGISQEKKIIKEEISFRDQLPSNVGFDNFYRLTFKGLPLEKPIIGYSSVLKNITLEKINKWHKKFYNKENIVELVYDKNSGKITVFSDKIKNVPRIQLKQDSRFKTVKKGFSSNVVNIGWPLINPTPKERIVNDILRRIIGGMSESFIYRKLIQELCIVYEGGAWLSHYNGLDFLQCQLFSTNSKRVLTELKKFKETLIKNGVEKEKFELAKRVEVDFYQYPEPYVAEIVGREYMSTGKLILPQERISIIKSITSDDLLSSARKLFSGKEFLTVIK